MSLRITSLHRPIYRDDGLVGHGVSDEARRVITPRDGKTVHLRAVPPSAPERAASTKRTRKPDADC